MRSSGRNACPRHCDSSFCLSRDARITPENGDYNMIYAAPGTRLKLTGKAFSRDTFARARMARSTTLLELYFQT